MRPGICNTIISFGFIHHEAICLNSKNRVLTMSGAILGTLGHLCMGDSRSPTEDHLPSDQVGDYKGIETALQR